MIRGDYKGPATIRLDGLLSGATAKPADIAPAALSATATIATVGWTEPGRSQVKIVLLVNGEKVDEGVIALIVEKPGGEKRESGTKRPERVSFLTVDGVTLVGTLYPGSKGKDGATVLMLHDLDHHRDMAGWRRLAEALQAEGHTVLTFDFRGHGDSQHVEKDFWTQSVNRYLPAYDLDKPLEEPTKIDRAGLPGVYVPWLIHDIAAARMFLDLRHDDARSPVNTFNLVVIGAGQASALGSLWLASEGLRCNADGKGKDIVLKPMEKLSVLQAVWIGMESKLNGSIYPVENWMRWANRKPVVPVSFVVGAEDEATKLLLQPAVSQKQGVAEVIPEAKLSGQRLLEMDPAAERRIRDHLIKSIKGLPFQPWVPRKIKTLHSYWVFPAGKGKIAFFTAKLPGEKILWTVPLERFDILLKGMQPRQPIVPGVTEK